MPSFRHAFFQCVSLHSLWIAVLFRVPVSFRISIGMSFTRYAHLFSSVLYSPPPGSSPSPNDYNGNDQGREGGKEITSFDDTGEDRSEARNKEVGWEIKEDGNENTLIRQCNIEDVETNVKRETAEGEKGGGGRKRD